ncbi:MAG: Uma2 family endonuclease [Acidobacteria bacterium]|nr:Uma2 family endonuclease [Acidobacteriota bacterium]
MSSLKENYSESVEYPESDGKPMGETPVHRRLMTELIFQLENFFEQKPDVYVSGNMMMYYVEGAPEKTISPDVFVVRGVEKTLERRIYKIWEEGQAPVVVIELSSRKTRKEDFGKKMELYAELGVKEYFVFDPEYPKKSKPLNAYRLSHGQYLEVLVSNGRVMSKELGLELVDTGATLRLYNPKTKQFLLTSADERQARQQAEATAQTQALARQQAEATAQAQALARQQAEAKLAQAHSELATLRAEIKRLKKRG